MLSARERIEQQEKQLQEHLQQQQQQPDSAESTLATSLLLGSMSIQLETLSLKLADLVTAQNTTAQALSTSQERETSFSRQLKSVEKGSSEISKTLELIAGQLASSEAVILPNGDKVSRADLGAYSMMTALQSEMKGMTATAEKLAAEVHKKAHITVDQSLVADAIAQRIEKGLVQRFEASQEAREARVEALGEAKVLEATNRIEAAHKAVQRYENIAAKLGRGLTWSGVGRVALALIPFAIAGLTLATLLGLGGEVLGIGPLFGWAWDSFNAAQLWWHKVLIAAGTLAGAAGVLWMVRVMGRKLAETYRGWR